MTVDEYRAKASAAAAKAETEFDPKLREILLIHASAWEDLARKADALASLAASAAKVVKA